MHFKTPGWAEQFVEVRAESALKKYAHHLLIEELNLGPDSLAYLAATATPLSELLEMVGKKIDPIPDARDKPGGSHLLGLSSQRVIELLGEVMPAHAEVLKGFPEYATHLTNEIKRMVLGVP